MYLLLIALLHTVHCGNPLIIAHRYVYNYIVARVHPPTTHIIVLHTTTHRGAPCQYPDETIEGYKAAINYGVDYLEMDLIRTKDGHLICRHDILLEMSTDVVQREEFAAYKSTHVMPDGRNLTG